MITNCKTCSNPFRSSPSKKRKFCTPACAYLDKDRVAHVVKKDRGSAACEGCGVTFTITTKAPLGKYCTQPCAARHIGARTILTIPRPVANLQNCICKQCGKEFKAFPCTHRIYCGMKCARKDPSVMKKSITSYHANPFKKTFSRGIKQWVAIGGQRFYAKSLGEANYARYLEHLKVNSGIQHWEYEPKIFWFEKIRRGVRSYLPDFRVTMSDGSIEWHEVKGWMDPKSITKTKRMAKYYPKEVLRIIGTEWFKKNSPKLKGFISGWQTSAPKAT